MVGPLICASWKRALASDILCRSLAEMFKSSVVVVEGRMDWREVKSYQDSHSDSSRFDLVITFSL